MGIVRILLTIIMIIISVIMTIVILMQEGKSQGLGAIAGSNSDTYWGRNKGRTMEGFLVKFTTGLVIVFFVLAILLNMGVSRAGSAQYMRIPDFRIQGSSGIIRRARLASES